MIRYLVTLEDSCLIHCDSLAGALECKAEYGGTIWERMGAMTQKQQLMAMLDSSGAGYGLANNYSGGVVSGVSVQVEAERPFEDEWYVTEFKFDNEGKLLEVFTYPGVEG